MLIDQSIINRITDRANEDIVAIVSRYLPLKQKGQSHWGLSPFKKESTASFCVTPAKGMFKCFATGIGGNAIKFLMEVDRKDWLTVIKDLAEEYQIDLYPAQSETQRATQAVSSRLRELLDWAANTYHDFLINSQEGQGQWEYLQERGYDLAACKRFKIGYAPASWNFITEKAQLAGYTEIEVIEAGLASRSDKNQKLYDRYRTRIMFPITNQHGQVVGFGGRYQGPEKDQAKYINSPETQVYSKSKVLYNFSEARKAIFDNDCVILTEGYTDTGRMVLEGFENTVATCGTALTPEQAGMLKRCTRNIILLRDGDSAGQKAAVRDIDICLESGMDVKVISLPDGKDPDEYLSVVGKEGMLRAVGEAKDWWVWRWESWEGNRESVVEYSRFAEDLVATTRKISSLTIQKEIVKEIAKVCNVDEGGLLSLLTAPSLSLDKKLKWEDYRQLCTRLGLDPNHEDIAKSEIGGVVFNYKTLAHKPLTWSNNGTQEPVTRDTASGGETASGVYFPPSLRDGYKEMSVESGGLLFIVQDEVTATLLCASRIPAVGISNPQGFRSGVGSPRPSKGLRALMSDFNRFVYVVPGEAFLLPRSSKKDQPYNGLNAGKNAEKYVKALSALNAVFPDRRNWVVYQNLTHGYQKLHRWVESLMLEQPSIISKLSELNEFSLPADNETLPFHFKEITNLTEKHFEEMFLINEPQRFFDFHGPALGSPFQLGKISYEVDTYGTVSQIGEEIEKEVFENHGRYYARTRGGYKPITNFKISCDLRIMGTGDDSFGIYELKNCRTGQTRMVLIKNKDFLKGENFMTRVAGIPRGGFFANVTSGQMADLLELVCEGSDEATNLKGAMGWVKLAGEVDEENDDTKAFWVFGNGILNGKWTPTNSKGLVQVDGETFFIPANSTIKENPSNHDKSYERQKDFCFWESDYAYEDWIRDLHKVYGINGHKAFSFAVMAMYYDLLLEKKGLVPLMHLMGPPGTGKNKLVEAIMALWGKLKWMDLNAAKITPAGYAAFFEQYNNALNIVNEYNPSSVDPARLDPIKSVYEGKLGEKKVGAHTTEMYSGKVTSAVIIMGQESIYERKAIAHRCLYCIFEERVYTQEETERFNRLEKNQKKGLGQIFKKLAIHRELIDQRFEDKFELCARRIKAGIQNPTGNTERLITNWSIMLSPIGILIEEGLISYPFTFDMMIANAIEEIESQDKAMISGGLLDIFFYDFVQTHYMQKTKYQLHHQHIFHQRDTKTFSHKQDGKTVTQDTPEGVITIQVSNIYSIFESFLKDRGKKIENAAKSDLRRLLTKHPAFICQTGYEWIGYKMNERGEIVRTGINAEKYRSSAFVMNAALLPISIDVSFSFESEAPEDMTSMMEAAMNKW